MSRPIYLDYNATTPVDPRVLEAMLPYFTECFGNAASIDHQYGNEALRAVEKARKQVADLIGAAPDEIIFTSGATESDNLAIVGTAEKLERKGRHLITCVTEHHAVLDTCLYLERKGWEVTFLPVDGQGLVDPADVKKAIRPDTVLISIMTANNEIGTIAPIAEIGQIARERNVLFHTDASQAGAYLPLNVQEMNVDLMSLSGHKMYAPKGVGVLYLRGRRPRVRVAVQIHGGGHERGFRSGTLNVPGIVGMGHAAMLAAASTDERAEIEALRDLLWEELLGIEGVRLNGPSQNRLPNNLSVFIPGVEGKSLITQLKNEVAFSTGSACTTQKVEPSHVIASIAKDEDSHSTVRLSLGRFTARDEVLRAGLVLRDQVQLLRAMFR